MRTYAHFAATGSLILIALEESVFEAARYYGAIAAQRGTPVALSTNSPELPIVAARLMCPEGDWTARITHWLSRHTQLEADEVFPSPFALNTAEAPTWAEVGEGLLVAAMTGNDEAFDRTAFFTVFDASVDSTGTLWLDMDGYRLRIPRDILGTSQVEPARRAA